INYIDIKNLNKYQNSHISLTNEELNEIYIEYIKQKPTAIYDIPVESVNLDILWEAIKYNKSILNQLYRWESIFWTNSEKLQKFYMYIAQNTRSIYFYF